MSVNHCGQPLAPGFGVVVDRVSCVAYQRVAAVASEEDPRVCLAIPGRIMEVTDPVNRLAKVEVAGVRRTVNIGLLDTDEGGAQPGDWVLIHVGFALSRVDEAEAAATLLLLQEMGAEYENELEELKASVIE
jgi:hydrogenase expression/formation protein HypC